MPNEFVDELTTIAGRLRAAADESAAPEVTEPLARLQAAATEVGRAWSGSPLGYHALVYYSDLQPPPAGAHWSSEWGDHEALSGGSRGSWREYTHEAVVEEIHRRTGDSDLTAAEEASTAAREQYNAARGEVASILTAYLGERQDELIDRLKADAEGILVGSAQQYTRATFPSGQIMTRDSLAMSQGFIAAPHITVQAQILALKAPFEGCASLADVADRAVAHMSRVGAARRATASAQGGAVFIGHGRSLLWRELKDFVQDRLALPWEEFNRVPVAGVTNIARLAEMLDAAGIAFLVLTAEDELADGQIAARQNVVHEAGLFQGRLGFTRAIVLLEEGCAEFSNIQGLGQIRFPTGKVGAAFEEVRRVLEREGFLDT